MSQYRSTGGLDDAIASDGDKAFNSVNLRDQLNQLLPTEVRESVNGRMEGYWKPRKSVYSRTGALVSGGNPLQLPFLLVGTSVLITDAVVASGVVTLTTASNHGLSPGATLNIQGIIYTAGTDPNGVFTATAAATNSITYSLAGGSGLYTVSNVTPKTEVITSTSKAFTFLSIASGTITITVTHGFAVGTVGLARIAGLTFTGVDPNGDRVITYDSATTLRFTVAGAVTVSGSGTLSQVPVNDSAAGNVRASCLFSNPNEQSKEYVIVALDTVAKKIDLDTYAVTTITYPTSETVDVFTDMQQCFDKVILFRDRKQALVWDGIAGAFTVMAGGNYTQPVIIDNNNNTVILNGVATVTHTAGHGLVEGDLIQIIDISGSPPAGPVIGDQYYVASVPIVTKTITAVTNPPTTTITITSNSHGLVVGEEITVSGLTQVGGSSINGTFLITAKTTNTIDYVVTTAPTSVALGTLPQITIGNTFTIYVDWVDHPNHTITFTKPQSSGGGFMHLPGAPWGTYFQRRLFVPYYYDQSGTGTITWVDRNIRDEVAISDILDENTYDQIYNQFRISGGTADQVVAMHGFFDDTMIVLNRNSIHSISNTSGNLTDTVVRELTSEIGCLARKTVLMRGNTMYFLSDNGVYGLEFLNDYNLRGMDQPLSKNIQPYIDRINPDKADKAVAVYFDNRYFLAVPLDSVAGANDAIGNNAVLVYNFLNKGWESIDTYGDSQFVITDYIKASGGVRDNLYAITSNGGLHQMEYAESINDRLSVSNIDSTIVTPQIAASLTSRGYNFASLERKRFTDTQIQMQNLAGETGEYSISFAAEDPDFATAIGTTSTFLGGMLTPSTANEAETATIRCRIGGVRGFTGTLLLNRTQGSPKVHSIMVAGSVTNRQIISQK